MLLRHSGILCHRGAGGEGSPGIIPGVPVLLQRTGILCHRGAPAYWDTLPQGCWGEGNPGIILGLPVLLRRTGILCHRGAGGESSPGIILHGTAGVTPVFRDTLPQGCWGGR